MVAPQAAKKIKNLMKLAICYKGIIDKKTI
jgi:hypothetical protein